jgi:hypothetical protein
MGSLFSKTKYKNPALLQQELEQLNARLSELEEREKQLEKYARMALSQIHITITFLNWFCVYVK